MNCLNNNVIIIFVRVERKYYMVEIDKKALGQRIKSIRLDKGMTLEEFGKLFGASKSSVLGWESGRNAPNKERLKTIAKLGDITVSQLISGETGSSHYNWEFIAELMEKFFNGLPIDKEAFEKTQKVIDLAFFLNLGIDDIVNIYLYQKDNISPLKTLKDLQEYFELSSDGLMSYADNADDETLIDLEMQAAFLNSYAYKIKRYLETGIWASPTISELKEKSSKS